MPKLPKFQTDEELIAWFDTHDTADYIDEMEEADETFAFLPTAFATRPVDLRLRADLFFAIERLADDVFHVAPAAPPARQMTSAADSLLAG